MVDTEAFFEQLLPVIDENVRRNDMLVPVLVVEGTDGRRHPIAVNEFFDKDHPQRKDMVLPMIEALFTNADVAMVALIAECWVKTSLKGTEEEIRRRIDEAGGVEGVEGRTEGVVVSIYARGTSDVSFLLEIKPGRVGVQRNQVYDDTNSKGRFTRKNPERN